MNTALEVKEDGKIWLITDCPEEPKKDDYEEYDDWSYAMRHYNLSLASAERIEIDNQDVAWKLIPFKENSSSVFREHGIYPIPDLRWEDYVKIGRKVINNFTGNYEIIQQKVAVIYLPESLPEK